MKTSINIESITTIENFNNFIKGNPTAAFTVLGDRNERYQLTHKTLIILCYITRSKPDKCVVVEM